MIPQDVISCSFATWYQVFKDVTEISEIIPLPESFITYLHTDGLVLPQSAPHGVYSKSNNLAMDGEDDDDDLRDDDLLKQYEADWSTCDRDETQAPDFGEFDDKVNAAIKSLGGRVFPKLNWSSPKDATWISFDKTLLCTCSSDVYLLLKSSEFVAHDLDQPFSGCDSEVRAPKVEYVLVLRKWNLPDPASEFRLFVHGHKIVGISQREKTKFYAHIKEEKETIIDDITTFHKQIISPRFNLSSYAFDVVRPKKGCVELIDFNPYGPVTDSLMFTWDELHDLARADATDLQFRCVETEDGVKISEYANYCLPLDIQDLTTGQDPYKMMDLLRLRAQQGDASGSSSEEEREAKGKEGDKHENREREGEGRDKQESTEGETQSSSTSKSDKELT